IADFGLSKRKHGKYVSCPTPRGTLPYMAPEVFFGNGEVSEKVDVYSMGVTLWQLHTGEEPFMRLSNHEILMGLESGTLHLPIPSTCDPEWRSLVETCMDPNPDNRPSFREIILQLQAILVQEQWTAKKSCSCAEVAVAAAVAVLDSDTIGRTLPRLYEVLLSPATPAAPAAPAAPPLPLRAFGETSGEVSRVCGLPPVPSLITLSGDNESFISTAPGTAGNPLVLGDSFSPARAPAMGVGLVAGGPGADATHIGAVAQCSPLRGVVKVRKTEVSNEEKIGEGAFGQVSRADVFPYGDVAIKWIKPEHIAKHSDAFLVEADILANLNHPNIVRMLGVVTSPPAGDITGDCNGGAATGVSDPVVGIVTEFVGNGTLGQVVRSPSGRLSMRQCARIALQVNEVASSSTSPSRR
ncbi:hypothetical protein VaNZ11_012125, partial [Volvox africanus]